MAYLNQPIDFGAAPDMGAKVQMPEQPKKKTGMFGSAGNIGEMLLGALSGYLAARGNPAGTMGLQALHQRRQQALDEAQRQQQRGEKLTDYAEMQKIQAQYGTPQVNDTVADYNFWKGVLSPEQFQQYVQNKVSPPQFVNMPGVGIVQIPQMGGAQMGAAAAPGVTFTPMDEGGPMPQASGGFPRPY